MSNRDRWAQAAYEILVSQAGHYHSVIDDSELGRQIQERTGVTTREGVQTWIGPVLELLVQRCSREGLPALTALVVSKDSGMVGDGYDMVLKAAGIPRIEDPALREEHAAQARLDCHRWASARDLPADGGSPAMAPVYASALETRCDPNQ